MAITKEDILNFIKEKEGKVEDFIIRTKDEEETYLENFKTAEVEKSIDGKIKDVHSKYDDYIFEVTGVKKNTGEKSFDFVKRIASEYKGKADKLPELEAKIADLTEKVGKNADAKLMADLENVRAEFANFKATKEKELEDLRKDTDYNERKAVLEAEANSFEYDESIKDTVLNVYKQTVINELLRTSEKREGTIIFLDDKGNPLRNQAKNLAPYTPNEIIAEKMKDVIKQKRVLPGPPSPGDLKVQPKSVPDSVKNKVQLSQWLMTEGYKRGTKEYDEIYLELGMGMPLE